MPVLNVGFPIPRWMDYSQPRINGDTRRRKRRIREKLAKQDAIRYAPAIQYAAAEIKRRVIGRVEHEIVNGPAWRKPTAAPTEGVL